MLQLAVLGAALGFLGFIHSAGQAQQPNPPEKQGQRKEGQRQRPKPQPLRVEKVSPRLQSVLERWEKSSRQIKTLQGKHWRIVYNTVFNVEKRAEGKFFYTAPDKGRIDIEPADIPEDAVSGRKGSGGKPFKLQPARPETWVCNGKEILQINEAEKEVEKVSIPPQARGRNIMDGPLPFLFGMPAEKAKKRYFLKLLKVTDKQVWLQAKPRWKQDAANYKSAKVILSKETFLPYAVKLVGPAGNRETVYRFYDLKVNEKPGLLEQFWQGNPFQPDLDGYQVVSTSGNQQSPRQKQQQPAQKSAKGTTRPKKQRAIAESKNEPDDQKKTQSGSKILMPSVQNYPWKKAKKLFEQAGFQVKFLRGQPAPRKELEYVVSAQKPQPQEPLKKGQTITLTLYDKIED